MVAPAILAIPPIVEGIVWLGAALGITHMVAPGKEEREQSIRDLGNAIAGNNSSAMSNAQDDAKANADSGATATTCTGQCAEDCARLNQQIESQAAALQRRLEDMVVDQHDLFNTARGLADNWGKGTWQGHIDRFVDERDTLKTTIAMADAKGCPVSQWARDVANETPPSRPGY